MNGPTKDLILDEAHPLLNDDLFLPEQFDSKTALRTPAIELYSALYLDAIYILIGKITSTREEWDEARAWLESDDEDHPFGFLRCCELLGINQFAARATIRKHLQEPIKRSSRRPGWSPSLEQRAKLKKLFTENRGLAAAVVAKRKLTETQVKEIQASTESTRELARRFGVARKTISRARKEGYRDALYHQVSTDEIRESYLNDS